MGEQMARKSIEDLHVGGRLEVDEAGEGRR